MTRVDNFHFPPLRHKEKRGKMGENGGKWGKMGFFFRVFDGKMGNSWAKNPKSAVLLGHLMGGGASIPTCLPTCPQVKMGGNGETWGKKGDNRAKWNGEFSQSFHFIFQLPTPFLVSPFSPFPPCFPHFPPFSPVSPHFFYPPPFFREPYRELRVPPGPGYSGPYTVLQCQRNIVLDQDAICTVLLRPLQKQQ